MENASLLNSIAMFMQDGGVFMWLILVPLIFGLSITIERFIKLYTYDNDGPTLLNEIQKFVLGGNINEGIKACSNSKSLLPKVFMNGLKRANESAAQIQNAIYATSLEVIPKVEKRLGYLGLLANIATLLGLLGTIQGLIETFQAIGAADPSHKATILSSGISKAMNTTAFGLVTAIIIMIFNAILNAKAEKIITEIDEFSSKLIDLLGTKKTLNDNTKE